MRNIKLYIGNDLLDLFRDESVQVTQTIQNTKDIGSVFSNFSASFAVPGSPTNNRIFEYYYNYQVIGFDARFKVAGRIEIDGAIFDSGYFKLNNVQIKGGKPHTYNITFFGELVNLKDVFGEDKLSGLNYDGYNEQYDQNTVANRLGSGKNVDGITNAIITPLIHASNQPTLPSATEYWVTDWRNLKYAIHVKGILKAIESAYGISFSGTFLSGDTRLNKLYMWLHRDKGFTPLPQGEYEQVWEGMGSETLWDSFAGGMAGYTMGSGWYYFGGSQGPDEARSHEVRLNLNTSTADQFTLTLYRNLNPIWTNTYSGSTSYVIDFTEGGSTELFDEGMYEVKIEYTNPIEVLGTSSWTFLLNVIEDQGPGYQLTDSVSQSGVNFGSTFTFNIAEQVPDIKVLDFLTGLFKMFNLTAYKDIDGNIVLQTLDDFYSEGIVRDWTQYVDDRNMTISPLTLYKEMEFSYEGLGSILADQHTKLSDKGWGTEEYASANKYEGTKYEIKAPFEHMKFERVFYNDTQTNFMYGLMTDPKNEPYVGKPLLFMAETETGSVKVYDDQGQNPITRTSYFMPKNVLDSNESIHFSAEFDEYTNTITTNSLFTTYYTNYILGVFAEQARLYKLSGKLPLHELINYQLNDTIEIRGTRFLINSVTTDITTGKSEFELKNIA